MRLRLLATITDIVSGDEDIALVETLEAIGRKLSEVEWLNRDGKCYIFLRG